MKPRRFKNKRTVRIPKGERYPYLPTKRQAPKEPKMVVERERLAALKPPPSLHLKPPKW